MGNETWDAQNDLRSVGCRRIVTVFQMSSIQEAHEKALDQSR